MKDDNLLNSTFTTDKQTSFPKEKYWVRSSFPEMGEDRPKSHRVHWGAPRRVCGSHPTAVPLRAQPPPVPALTSCILFTVKARVLFSPRSSISDSLVFLRELESQHTMHNITRSGSSYKPVTEHWSGAISTQFRHNVNSMRTHCFYKDHMQFVAKKPTQIFKACLFLHTFFFFV